MNPPLRAFSWMSGRRWWTWGLAAACPALAVGCVPTEQLLVAPRPVAQAVASPSETQPASQEKLPPPTKSSAPTTQQECVETPTAEAAPKTDKRLVPVSLDAVLRLAEEQNVKVALAREKLQESQTEQCLADFAWLPNIHAGLAYYRHEGGIQNEIGTLTRSSTQALFPGLDLSARLDLREGVFQRLTAERKTVQQEGELSRVTTEILLEAATTYVDLLAARTSEAVLKRTQEYQEELLRYAEALRKSNEPGSEALVAGIRSAAQAREIGRLKLKQQGDAAAAKLAYLLGLGADVVVIPVETALRPVSLTETNQPTDALISQALASGPGVRELETLLSLIQSNLDEAAGPSRLLPTFELRTLAGGFGAGPGANLNWDDRVDIGLQVRWNLTSLLTARERERLGQSKLRQAQLSYDDLKGKLTLGVQEAQGAIQNTQQQIRLVSEQIGNACTAYRLSNLRMLERAGGTPTEVLATIQGLELAHLNSLTAIRAHNQAQIRLMILLGANAPKQAPAKH